MKRAHLHAPPGEGQTWRIHLIQATASREGHLVRIVTARERAPGWKVLVIRVGTGLKETRRDLQTRYTSYDFIGTFSPPG